MAAMAAMLDFVSVDHEGNTMRKIMGNKPQVSLAIIIQSSANILE
jgi:hypothetical protein